MRNSIRLLLVTGAMAVGGALGAPLASADTTLITTPPNPDCTQVSGSAVVGGETIECSTPGNVQLNATPEMPDYPYPWADEFYGPALVIGGGGGYAPPIVPIAPHGGR